MATPADLKYRAFLSYAHTDASWGRWLHRRIEGFRIDHDLVGRVTRLGAVPKTLRPIFRDRDDFSGGHSLNAATLEAIDDSAALIVVCSAVAATRPTVNEEVRLFRSRHPDRPVIPVIINGTFPDNFPPALRFEIARGGRLTGQPVTILGPDLRDTGDGRALGLAKLVAGLTGVGTDEIVRRAERDQRRRLHAWVAGLSTVAVSLAGLTVWAEVNRREAVAQWQRDLANAHGRIGDVLMAQGKLAAAMENYQAGFDIRQRLANADPANATAQFSMAMAQRNLGKAHRQQGSLPLAEAAFEASRSTLEALTLNEPANTLWAWNHAAAFQYTADVMMDQGKPDPALRFYREYEQRVTAVARSDPDNARWQRDLGSAKISVGFLLRSQGNLPAALDSYRAALAVRERLVTTDPANTGWQHDLSLTLQRVGFIATRQGQRDTARASYQRGLEIVQRLVDVAPDNAVYRRDVTWFQTRLAELKR